MDPLCTLPPPSPIPGRSHSALIAKLVWKQEVEHEEKTVAFDGRKLAGGRDPVNIQISILIIPGHQEDPVPASPFLSSLVAQFKNQCSNVHKNRLQTLKQCFSNIDMQAKFLGILLKMKILIQEVCVGPEILHF